MAWTLVAGPEREKDAMDAAEIIVTLGGVAAIAWVIWHFFLAERRGGGDSR